jgi:hypothetical protein
MTPSNVLRGALALFAFWLDAVPALLAGEVLPLLVFSWGLLSLVGAMFVRELLPRRAMTAGAVLVLGAVAAMTLKVTLW